MLWDSSIRKILLENTLISEFCYAVFILSMQIVHKYFFLLNHYFFATYLQIGQYIASNGGVVAAEELAPYLDIQKKQDMVC